VGEKSDAETSYKEMNVLLEGGAPIFQKPRTHLKILRVVRITSSKFDTKDPQFSGGGEARERKVTKKQVTKKLRCFWKGMHQFSKNLEPTSKFLAS
jgi:hypothetical protein